MTALLAFRLATYLLALDGLFALHVGGLIGNVGAAVVAGLVVMSWWQDRLRDRLGSLPRLDHGLVVVATVGSVIDLLYFAETLLDGFVHLLLFLLVYRLFTRRSLRDARDIGFLSFFMLVAGSAVTFGIGFLFAFLAFLVLGVWTFILHHVLTEAERAGGQGDAAALGRARVGPSLLTLSVAAAVGTLVITFVLFFLIPRVGQATIPLRGRVGGLVAGFSDRVELGAFGEIEADLSVVMRVHFPEGPAAPELLQNLRWRGMVLDHFDGRAWSVSPDRRRMSGAATGYLELARHTASGPLVMQEVYLEPIGSEVIFAAPRIRRLELRAERVTIDDTGSVHVATPAARLRYVAYSELESSPPAARVVAPLSSEDRERYLQLPPLPPRIDGLARQLTAGTAGPYHATAKLTAYLQHELRYTLALRRSTDLPPLEEFLFVQRAGNCEYFAAALAVMLRAVGIPARVVTGFQQGEWNPYGRYFMVRNRDAHSWVEAFVPEAGWVTFDPSPRAPGNAAAGPSDFTFYFDSLRMRWYRYVVNWSLKDQLMTAATLHREMFSWKQRMATGRLPVDVRAMALPSAVVLAGAGMLVFGLRRAGAHQRRGSARMPTFYAMALRALARRGVRPEPDETAREFLVRAGATVPGSAAALATLTEGYERARFAAAPPSVKERAELDGCLATLREVARSRGGPGGDARRGSPSRT